MTQHAGRTLTYDARRTWGWVVAWLLCTIATLALAANTTTARVDPDEFYWIGSTYYYHLAFEQGDWSGAHPDWKLIPARENPPVAKYVLGLGLALSGRHVTTLDGLGSFYAYYRGTLGNSAPEHVAKQAAVTAKMDPALFERVVRTREVFIDPGLLIAGRRVVLVCGAITSLLVFVLGMSVSGPGTGLLASQILLVHPAVRFAYDHAMSDAVAFMFGTAAALATWHFYRSLNASAPSADISAGISGGISAGVSDVLSAVISGVTLGLACGAKMNWLIAVFLFAGAVLVAALHLWRRGERSGAMRVLGLGAVAGVTAFAVFVIANPTIRADPIAGLIALVREPQLTTAVQARVLSSPVFLATFGAKLGAVSVLMLRPAWLFAMVAFAVALACVKMPSQGVRFVLGWWVIALACVTMWIPFEWKRYVLPVVIPFTLLFAHAVVAGVGAMARRFEIRVVGRAEPRSV